MDQPTFELYAGDARAGAATLPDGSLHLICTSPPYYGLRLYGGEPQVWPGPVPCAYGDAHVWDDPLPDVPQRAANRESLMRQKQGTNRGSTGEAAFPAGRHCAICQAWEGHLGNEPRVEMFVRHLVDVFEAFRPKLRDDGNLWVNLGDSFSRNPAKGGNHTGKNAAWGGGNLAITGRSVESGVAEKSLYGVPWRFALAMQAAGWVWRGWAPWIKPNGMPNSAQDRMIVATEVFLHFTKGPAYFWDAEAVRKPFAATTLPQIGTKYGGTPLKDYAQGKAQDPAHAKQSMIDSLSKSNGRLRRDTDWWMESVEQEIQVTQDYLRALVRLRDGTDGVGVVLDGDDLIGLVSHTAAYAGQHFASYPQRLVTPCILAGCRPGDRVGDPFSGVATTGVVALKQGRSYWGSETNPAYLAEARTRLERVRGQRDPAREGETDAGDALQPTLF
jgi:DNA modification methylase